jgi:imidazolonepropionase-like amidohydrolase
MATCPAFAQTIAIRAGSVIDPVSGIASDAAVILVEDGRITAVGPNERPPRGATIVDLSSAFLSPGLFDTHTHLTAAYRPGTTLREYTIAVSTAERALQGVVNAWQMLSSGFTTVRDMGNAGEYADAALAWFFGSGDPRRRQIYGGALLENVGAFGHPLVGPTIVFSGKIITPFGGQFLLSPEHPEVGHQDYIYADTHDALRDAIRQNVHYGATWIKVAVDDFPYQYSVADLRFIVAEAAAAGALVAAHCMTEIGANAAIAAGVASIEHGYEMRDSTLARAWERGIYLVGTEPAGEFNARFGRSTRDSAIVDRLRRAHRAGTPLAFGADIIRAPDGLSRGAASLSVIDSWIRAGVPAPDILKAMTVDAAQLLGMNEDRGVVQPGFAADLIATTGNPLENIRALEDVVFVMKNGVVFRTPE